MHKNITTLIAIIFVTYSTIAQAHWKIALTGEVTAVSFLLHELKNQHNDIIFIDRSIGDQLTDDKDLEKNLKQQSFDLVFFCTPHDKLKEIYNAAGYRTIIDIPAQDKAQFVDGVIAQRLIFGDVIDCFAGYNTKFKIKEFMNPVRLIEADMNGYTYRFFGVHKDKQLDVDFPLLKQRLMDLMGVTNKKLVQVVGDSGVRVFSKEGSDYARKLLEDRFDHCGIIEYGFTGYAHPNELDVNGLVNEYIDNHPEAGHRVLANIVGHIHIALNKWGCYVSPHVRNFVVVYNDDGMTKYPSYDEKGNKIGGFTVFSEDVIMSDHMLQAEDGDVTISLEGGTQCWKQSINMLSRSIALELVYNIRIPHKQHHFSVARFLKEVVDAKPTTPEQVRALRTVYEQSLQHLWDTTRQDNSDMNYGHTKMKLLNDCMEELINKNLYQKVASLCVFSNAQES